MQNNARAAISEIIKKDGHITVDNFMEICLFNPTDGYYNKSGQFGRSGDFVTSPEISQLFGEIIGLWCVSKWMEMGSPNPFSLIELGPGRGTMMADILRTANKFPDFLNAARVILVERGKSLKELQKKTLNKYDITHIDDIEALIHQDLPSIIVANEFFDAFPVQQFELIEGKWFEKTIIEEGSKLSWSRNPVDFIPPAPEVSKPSEDYMERICKLLKKSGGYFLFIDYGYREGHGHSLQALSHHEFKDILDDVGNSDLSAHVNFARLLEIACDMGLEISEPISQAQFLSQNGIIERAKNLMDKNAKSRGQVESEVMRLIHPQQMGTLFKVAMVRGTKYKEQQ